MKKFTKFWDINNATDYYNFHIFKNELDDYLDKKLEMATKYKVNFSYPNIVLENIVKKIRISDKKLSESDIRLFVKLDEIEKSAKEMKENTEKFTKEAKQIFEDNRNYTTSQSVNNIDAAISKTPNKNKSKKLFKILSVAFLTIILTIFFIFLYESFNNENTNNEINILFDQNVLFTNSNVKDAFLNTENHVKVSANVLSFKYDELSGTKFIQLDIDGYVCNAVVFSNIETPYIYIGEEYTVNGITQIHENEMELNITEIE